MLLRVHLKCQFPKFASPNITKHLCLLEHWSVLINTAYSFTQITKKLRLSMKRIVLNPFSFLSNMAAQAAADLLLTLKSGHILPKKNPLDLNQK